MSEPQLIIMDPSGKHNANLLGTQKRLAKSAAWKRQRIICIIPADVMIPAKCALSLWSLIFPPNNNVIRILAQGAEVGCAYSLAVEQILSHPELKTWEYIFTCEHDMLFPCDAILRLLERMEEHPELSAISVGYYCKFEGGVYQAWGDISDPLPNFRPILPIAGALQECYGLGMGGCLFRLKMFHDPALPRPFFQTRKSASGTGTQDLFLWQNARQLGYRCAVDSAIQAGHLDISTGDVW